MEDCIFCKIIKKEAPATVVEETDQSIAIQNLHPVAKVHLLIMPKNHIVTFLDLDNSGVLFDMTKMAQDLVNKNNIQGGYKLVFNGGKFQAVPHLHWHLLGGELEDKNDVLNKL